ncbi:MAG: hypothetical protein GX410_02225 [Elusimicrobia bacterium]|nr:hypothetical protein [Elusimicrobiota bacterium]
MKAKVFWTALALFAASLILGGGYTGALLLAGAALVVALRDWRALREFGSLRFWIPLLLFVLLMPFFIPGDGFLLLGRPYSAAQFASGMRILGNAYVFTVLAAFVSRNFSLREIVEFAERCGGRNTGLRIALVTASSGMVKRALAETWLLYSAGRGGIRLLSDLPVFMAAVLRNTAMKAEQIALLFFIRDIGV